MAAPTYTLSSTVFTNRASKDLRVGLGVCSITSTYTIATVADAALIAMCKIPKGATVLDVKFSANKALASGTPTVKVGTYDRTTDTTTDTAFIPSTAVASALMLSASGQTHKHAAITNELEVFVTTGAASGPASTVIITVDVLYTMDR